MIADHPIFGPTIKLSESLHRKGVRSEFPARSKGFTFHETRVKSAMMSFRFDFRPYRLTFQAPVRTAHGHWKEREGLVVRLEDEDGRAGFGECAPIPWFGMTGIEEHEATCRQFGEHVAEQMLESIPHSLSALRFAIQEAKRECARARLRVMEEPAAVAAPVVLPAFLPVAALLPAGRAALAGIAPKAELGFRTFKWKIGVAELSEELGVLDDLLGEFPSGAKLRLDANGALDRRRAEKWLERCADRPIEFLEQPIAPDAKNAEDILLGLAGDYPTPLALDEAIVRDGDVEHWLQLGWPGVFVLKLALLGDVEKTLERLRLAKSSVVFSSALETGIGAFAALRRAFAFGENQRALGFGVWPLFKDSRFDGPFAAPFIRREDLEYFQPDSVWNALA